jgi:parallel beta-helix repeat protein
VTNSAIYHGLGWGVNVQSSANVLLKNNVVYGFVKMGISLTSSDNITIDGNIVMDVSERSVIALDKAVDIVGGILGCAYTEGDLCQDISIVNNIVAGVYFVGLAGYGHTCDKYTSKNFRNNTAHSIDGVGHIIFKDPYNSDHSTCLEGSYNYAYKITLDGAIAYYDYKQVQFTNIIFVDVGYAATPMVG